MNVADNGRGFDIGNVKAYNGNGLQNMKARAKAINGDLKIESGEGKGTTITLRYNIDPPL